MASVNKAIIVGNLGRDPETRSTGSERELTTIDHLGIVLELRVNPDTLLQLEISCALYF